MKLLRWLIDSLIGASIALGILYVFLVCCAPEWRYP
jgi:hypothetical protein